jgi:hypothetical protein
MFTSNLVEISEKNIFFIQIYVIQNELIKPERINFKFFI